MCRSIRMLFRYVKVKQKNQLRELKLVSSEEGKWRKRWKLLSFFFFFSTSLARSSINLKIKTGGGGNRHWKEKRRDLWSQADCNLTASANNKKPYKCSCCFCLLSPCHSPHRSQVFRKLPSSIQMWSGDPGWWANYRSSQPQWLV